MRPSRIHYVLAHGLALCTWGGSAVALVLTLWIVVPAFPALTLIERGYMVVVAIPASIGLGWIMAALVVWPFVYAVIRRINGAPFSVGDQVHVLCGPHSGSRAAVYELWPSRGQVRVDLGKQEKADVKDVFGENQVCRAADANDVGIAKI